MMNKNNHNRSIAFERSVNGQALTGLAVSAIMSFPETV